MQGRSFAPAFRGQALHRAKPIFWEHEGNRPVRDGKWKLVARFSRPWQLFDMSHARSETRDLAAANPAPVREMAAGRDTWAATGDRRRTRLHSRRYGAHRMPSSARRQTTADETD